VQMAEIFRQQGKIELAEQSYTNAIANYEKAVGPNNPELIMPLESMADFYYTTKVQYDQVASIYQLILKIVRVDPDANPLTVAQWERNLADVYRLQGQNVLAENGYKQALATAETVTNSVDDQVQSLQLLADFYQAGGRYDQAELQAQRALAIRERACVPDAGPDAQLGVAVACDALAQIYLARNQPDQAESFYNRSLAIAEKVSGADSPDLTPRLMGLATALRAQKKYATAEAQYKRALAITEKSDGTEAPEVADVLDQYATLLADMNKSADAKSMVEWANSLRQQNAARTN
jgi:tetratricopeptide (TPR) repeat protein